MAECKWCGEECKGNHPPGYCSEACAENDIDQTWDEEKRLKLQKNFDSWLEAQEEELEESYEKV